MNTVIRYAICDDEPALVEHISDVSENLLKDGHLVYELKKYSNSHELYLDIYDGVRFDIVLLDIEMPEHSGLEIAKLLKEKQPECLVIFLTSFKEYAVDAFELEIFRYIPKDQLELRFGKYFMEAVNLIRELDEKAYIVEGINSAEKLPFKSIRYLKKQGKYTSIVCTDNRETKVRKPINVVIEELNSPDFVVIDRGCAVNICYISRLCDNEVHLKNGERLAVSRSNLKTVRRILIQYWGEIY